MSDILDRLRAMAGDCRQGQRTGKSDRWALTLENAAAAIEQRDAEIARLREALRAIKHGLASDNHEVGDYWKARKLLDTWDIYHGNINGTRVLLELARAALAAPALAERDAEIARLREAGHGRRSQNERHP